MSARVPYGRQWIDEEDIAAVTAALRAPLLTGGPRVQAFEDAFAAMCGARHGVAVNSGTAALHAAVHALGIGPGDEIIVPALTFVATANAVVYAGATPVFADVEPDTLLLDPASVAARVTPRTRAIIAVDYAGQPCDYGALDHLCARHTLRLIADACHAPGATYRGRAVGTLADITCFSFHPVKHLTTAEGGMAVTDDPGLARVMARFRNHGIDRDAQAREAAGSHAYDMVELGCNYRLSDLQSALGLSQLRHLDGSIAARRALATVYDARFENQSGIVPLAHRADRTHARHLYVVRLPGAPAPRRRDAVFAALRAQGIGVAVHYGPVHCHTFYRTRFATAPGLCPVAEAAAEDVLTLPLFPALTREDMIGVAEALTRAVEAEGGAA